MCGRPKRYRPKFCRPPTYPDLVTDYDPRIVDLYDEDNPAGLDHAFFRALADECQAHEVLDLGCGTGMLTVGLATGDRTVVGVDPSPAMIAFARNRPGAQRVAWVTGDSSSVPRAQFDFALMTSNVAQHISDPDWTRTLSDLRSCMRVGGVLAFDSRNPLARAWDDWDSPGKTSRDTQHGPLVEWMEAELIDDRTVQITAHNLFTRTGDTVTIREALKFRARAEIESDLRAADFDIEAVYSDWSRTPFDDSAQVMVFVARAR